MHKPVDDFLTTNIKALLQEKLYLLENRLDKKRRNTSYEDLTDAESRLLAALRGENLTISELARRQKISRQAVHRLVSSLAKRNLITLEAIQGNLKNKRIVFTKDGENLKTEAKKILFELEKEIESVIGLDNLIKLKALLTLDW